MIQRKTLLSVLVLLVLVAALLLAASTASADKGEPPVVLHNSHSVTGANPPPMGGFSAGPIQRPAALINDGNFENGPPPGSAWTEVSSTACEWIDNWSSVWGGVGARDGSQDYWGGGYCGGTPTTSSVMQSDIPVAVSDSMLRFWILSYRPDPDDAQLDQAYLQVNGTTVWTYNLVQANDTYPNWVEKSVNLAAYAGQYVTFTAFKRSIRVAAVRGRMSNRWMCAGSWSRTAALTSPTAR